MDDLPPYEYTNETVTLVFYFKGLPCTIKTFGGIQEAGSLNIALLEIDGYDILSIVREAYAIGRSKLDNQPLDLSQEFQDTFPIHLNDIPSLNASNGPIKKSTKPGRKNIFSTFFNRKK